AAVGGGKDLKEVTAHLAGRHVDAIYGEAGNRWNRFGNQDLLNGARVAVLLLEGRLALAVFRGILVDGVDQGNQEQGLRNVGRRDGTAGKGKQRAGDSCPQRPVGEAAPLQKRVAAGDEGLGEESKQRDRPARGAQSLAPRHGDADQNERYQFQTGENNGENSV